ncbi:hypothetical protein [Parasphingorhabdus sp.]|uniref:hypothetical protein n=1 Tax=Parasphingorhabdus sp. TaxID=2709688 RepID=UPI0010FEEBC6
MKIRKFAACVAASALIASPALAQSQQNLTQTAASGVDRVAAVSKDDSKLEGGNESLIGILVAASLIAGFFIIAETSDGPSSP